MDTGQVSYWLWIGFGALILLMLFLDLGLFNRKAHAPTSRESLMWSLVWVMLALSFSGVIFWQRGSTKGMEFLAGYLIELSLSVDNLFIFLLIFSYFKVPGKLQHRVLFWGVIGALVMRVAMIFLGAALIEQFHWAIYIFGAFLIYTGARMFGSDDIEIEPEDNPVVRFIARFVPMTHSYSGEKFFTRVSGRRVGTLLLLVLVVVEVTDLVFAVDSIPAIFGVTTDRFIVYSSNVFAIMGLRTLFFLLAGVIEKFHYLKIGLALVLSFIGAKMVLPLLGHGVAYVLEHFVQRPHWALWVEAHAEIPITASLSVVALVLASSVVASMKWPRPELSGENESDLGADFEVGFDDDDSAAEP